MPYFHGYLYRNIIHNMIILYLRLKLNSHRNLLLWYYGKFVVSVDLLQVCNELNNSNDDSRVYECKTVNLSNYARKLEILN